MGTDNQHWASQLKTDLENLYENEGLKILGGYSLPRDFSKFKLLMYSVEAYERMKKFDLEVEAYHSSFEPNELQELLNDKYYNENKVLKTALNVYEIDHDSPDEKLKIGENSKKQKKPLRINTQLLIFQDMNVNTSKKEIGHDLIFIVVPMPKIDKKKDPSESIQLLIRENRRRKGLFLVAIIPKTRMSDSLLVFVKIESFKETSNFGERQLSTP
jgi:hypothetical protein